MTRPGRAAARALAITVLASLAAPSIAADVPFAGTWASDLAQCKSPQSSADAPMIVTNDGFDQHEAHCKFTSVEGTDPDWTVKASCQVEGDAQEQTFKFTLSGDTLTQTDEAGSRDLLKCP